MYELCVESQFDSAHSLRRYDGPCESLHGHTYKVQVYARGQDVDENGVLVDFRRLKTVLANVVSYLDHKYLNELPEFRVQNPTAELIAKLIFERMRQELGATVAKVVVWETPTSSAAYFE